MLDVRRIGRRNAGIMGGSRGDLHGNDASEEQWFGHDKTFPTFSTCLMSLGVGFPYFCYKIPCVAGFLGSVGIDWHNLVCFLLKTRHEEIEVLV
jgi:hypothetical protein